MSASTKTIGHIGRCLLLSALLSLGGCKKTVKVDSVWADNPVVVDGLSGDWAADAALGFPDQKARVGIANDSSVLHLLLEFGDLQMARAIASTGLRLEFRNETSDNDLFTLRYHGGPPPESMYPSPGQAAPGFDEPPPDFDGPPPEFDGPGVADEKTRRMFTCEIRGRIIEKEIPTDGSEGPRAAFVTDRDRFCYEFSIPLKRGTVRYYGLGVKPGDRVFLTAVWGDRGELNRGEKRPGGFMGGPTGGMPMGGGPSGGGPSGPMPGGPGRGRGGRGLPEKQEVRLVISLAPR